MESTQTNQTKLKALKNLIKLSDKIVAYIPATIHNLPCDNTDYVNKVADFFSLNFGGATSTQAKGFYHSEKVGLIVENTTLVTAYCNSGKLENSLDAFLKLMSSIKGDMEQESVAFEINNEMYFI